MTEAFRWREAPHAQFAVIGSPVSHSLSPRMQNAALAEMGLPLRYVAIEVPVGEVGEALARLRDLEYVGANVTVPHKAEAFGWLAEVDDSARRLSVVNTVRFSGPRGPEGISTDGPGFLDTLADLNVQPAARATLLGAGGSARAIAAALADAGYAVSIFNRTRERAEKLIADLNIDAAILDLPEVRSADVVVNATAASLTGGDLGIDWASAQPETIAYDLMYAGGLTPFLLAAANCGLRTVDGRALLVAQGARSLEWWLGRAAPRGVMTEAIR